MAGRRRAVTLGEARGHEAVATVCRELDEAIRTQGLSYATVAADVGLSGSQVSRIARGQSRDLSIVQASRLLASVGLDLSLKTYPTGRPVRDRAHLDLLARLRARLHRSLTWHTEVPVLRGATDLRAWDAVIGGDGWADAVEAEVRLRDIQALDRRVALKQRDGLVDAVLLLVWNTRTNRDVLREFGAALRTSFPLPGTRALELLEAGVHPGANALIVL
jgi:transcriptional regulator with XRE-family HTH domain